MCKVLEVSRKVIRTKEGAEKAMLDGIIADHTAKIPFVSWNEREELVRDKVVQIENANVKKWKGLATLHMGRNARVSAVESNLYFPSRTELMTPKMRKIDEILGCEGAFDVILEGDIVSVPLSREENRGKIVLDDGTGAVFLELIGKEKENKDNIMLFGMSIKARGNVIAEESRNGYVLLAEKVKIKDERIIIKEMKNFLCRYT